MISDVLLQHRSLITRKWVSSLLPNLKIQGFTTLAALDPSMHPLEETQAVTGLFDGEIRLSEKEEKTGTAKILRIRKLVNQKYIDADLVLNAHVQSNKATS